ncbi:hypothetical protein L0668_05570 [Paraglaciecola aquimarina]|uniref:DUF8051 domain-containing protein n=1 Tax=Paraglaciecola algarum TaxID=3050085 RepID=A0ABS9D3S1_9ALTE|nr:hypothetical protein [Paraglaciecola sp. G1-23]MCF2947568.1 hypothetical protein [Paraglaciecola sp. G1-23]
MPSFFNKLQNRKLTFYLILNALLLISLIPGGPIENRDFSHIPAIYLIAFNGVLTALGMSSLLVAPLASQNYTVVAKVSKIIALAYLAVYVLDLFAIFPQTPSPMPWPLLCIELLGCLAAGLLYIEGCCYEKRIMAMSATKKKTLFKSLSPLSILLMVLVANGIVIFSTYSAIHSGT